jgi:hypothetical protein
VERLVAEASIGVVRIGQGRGRVIIRVSEANGYPADHEEPAISASSVRVGERGEVGTIDNGPISSALLTV